MQPFPHPNDATHKIWSRLANWLQRYSSSKVWNFRHSRASNSKMSGLIRPKIELDGALMPVLVTSNFDDDSIKNKRASMETPFSHYKYRRLSLSPSPGDQTKYFELSVVWDSQFVTSFTLYTYTDCLDHRDYNLHVPVFRNDVLELKYPLTELLISDTNFEKAVTEIKECWRLLTSKNAVKQCSITKVTKAPLRTLWV